MPRPIFVNRPGEQPHWAMPGSGAWVPNPHIRQTWNNPGGGLPPGSPRPIHVAAHTVRGAYDPVAGMYHPHTERAHWALPGGHWIANPNLPAGGAPNTGPTPAEAAAAASMGMNPPPPAPPPVDPFADTGGPISPVMPTVEGPPRRVKRKKGKGRR